MMAEHVARRGEVRNALKILLVKLASKHVFRHTDLNGKITLKRVIKIIYKSVDYNHLINDMVIVCLHVASNVMYLLGFDKCRGISSAVDCSVSS